MPLSVGAGYSSKGRPYGSTVLMILRLGYRSSRTLPGSGSETPEELYPGTWPFDLLNAIDPQGEHSSTVSFEHDLLVFAAQTSGKCSLKRNHTDR